LFAATTPLNDPMVSDESVEAPAVSEPRVAPPVALNWPVIVVEPVTAKEVEVAP